MTSTRRTAAAVVIAAGLFGYIYFVESKKDPKSDPSGTGLSKREKVFADLDKGKVKSITLKKQNGDTVLAEKNGEIWTLVSPQEARADADEISALLDTLQNLETEEIVSEGTTDLAAFGLGEPKIRVTLVAEGAAKPFEFELGDSVPAGSGVFARVPGSPRLFTVSSTLENTLSKSAFDLRDRSVLKVKREAIRSVEAIALGKAAQKNKDDKDNLNFRLVRGAKGEDEWKIEAPVTTRAARFPVDSFLGLLENLRMESIATEEAKPQDLADYGLGSASRRVVLALGEAKSVVLEIGKKADGGKYYAREASSKLVSRISNALIDDLDKGLKNLRATRLLDVAIYEVTGFDVTAAGVTRTFTKTTTKNSEGAEQVVWKSTAPSKDATQEKTSDAMFAIGALDAAEFIDAPKTLATYGLDAPQLRVTLRFEGDKKEDWFEVAVKDDAAFARRRDDSSVLKLDKAKTEALIKNFTILGS